MEKITHPLSISPLLLMSNMSASHKIILAQILQFDSAGCDCRLSNATLGEMIGVSADRASRIVKSLISDKYIQISVFDGRARHLVPTELGRSLGVFTNADPVKTPKQTRQIHQGRLGRLTMAESVKTPSESNKELIKDSISNEAAGIEREFFLKNISDYKDAAKRYIDYYEARGWVVNGTLIIDKLALARQWELKAAEKKPRFPVEQFEPIRKIAEKCPAELIPALANIFRVEISKQIAIFYLSDPGDKDKIDTVIASRPVVDALNSIGINDIKYKIKI